MIPLRPMAHPYFDVAEPTVIAHRGSAGEAPENTLPSFERALAQGAAILESDIHGTRDGVPVLIHDDVVDRCTDGSGAVGDHSFDALRRLDAGYRFTPDSGRSYPQRGRGIRIPSLAEALEAFPGARFNLELKERRPDLVANTVTAVANAGREALTLLTAGEDQLMAELRDCLAKKGVDVAQGACLADILAFIQSAQRDEPPPSAAMALQVPAHFAGRPLVTARFVEHAHAHGLRVHVWTIDEVDEMNALLDLGVDGLVTNFPGRMVGVLAARAEA